jgi:tetratricopeptide (TPR) repeat protein
MQQQKRKPANLWLAASVLGLVTLALYSPLLGHQFLLYDDQQYVTENARVQTGLSWGGMAWAFKASYATNWHPLTWLSHMLDCQIYGLHPAGHHLTSLLLHTANTLLLFLVLRRLTGAPWRSFGVAALFAWHPLQVESVAWVAERKDVLSAFFFLLTIWAYAEYVSTRLRPTSARQGVDPPSLPPSSDSGETSRFGEASGRGSRDPGVDATLFYAFSLAFFALALMSKPMVVTLPFVLLLLDYWPLRRLEPARAGLQDAPRSPSARTLLRLAVEKLPFLALSAASCALTLWAQQQAMVSTAGLGISQRIGHALLAYVHYLWAMILPRHLAVYYPYDKAMSGGEIFLAGVLLALMTALVIGFARRLPYLATGWFWFLGMLVPVIGLVQVGDQAWADRYTYLPSIGLFIAAVWGLADLAGRAKAVRTALPWVGAAAAAALLAGTSVQLGYWKDTRTLFEHVDQVTRRNPLSATLLGSLLAQEGKYDQAIEHYRTALSYSPDFPEAHFYLGRAFDQQGKLDEAIGEYQQALWFKPIQEGTHICLGIALGKQKKPEEAVAHYEAALKLDPDSAVAHNDIAKLLHSQGRLDEAILHYSAALKSDPSLAQAHNNLGVLFLQKGRVAEGVAQLREAVRLRPEDPESQINLAQGLIDQEQWSEAASLFSQTVTAATSDPRIHYRFGRALAHLHRTREAMSQFASALLLRQDFADALNDLSWILATDSHPEFRNGAEAVRMSEPACELTGRKDPAKLKTLAAAYAEAGRFPEAAGTVQAALELAVQAGSKDLAEECRLMLQSFQSARPWRAGD